MRLLTHNLLCGPKGGYPLKLKVDSLEELEAEFDGEYVKRLIGKIEWNGLLSVLNDLHMQGFFKEIQMPADPPPFDCEDEELLKMLHHVLNEIKVIDGQLECPDTHATFTVKDGIPKMIFEDGDVGNK
uniref:Multifunctional methyltransferase subunit TRM112-like protein n=1 Tax=Eutreptiella gymnastica TaxID=73025 RepID=A0A7S1I6R3_9EUGL|mmetsp:Transcript_134157/g.232918  ORF Transcript_134157/g.232918 Transcript_134157/m.232918 type:complete len:128 (+) Transcript_134157:75-458(+)